MGEGRRVYAQSKTDHRDAEGRRRLGPLDSSDFVIPPIDNGAAAEGAAEAQLTLSALKYGRFARGGRLDPVSLSNILDMKPPVKDARSVMRDLANASDPGAYLRGLNPKHVGFERLRQALLKARGETGCRGARSIPRYS